MTYCTDNFFFKYITTSIY